MLDASYWIVQLWYSFGISNGCRGTGAHHTYTFYHIVKYKGEYMDLYESVGMVSQLYMQWDEAEL